MAEPGECSACGRPGPAWQPCRYCGGKGPKPDAPARPATLFERMSAIARGEKP